MLIPDCKAIGSVGGTAIVIILSIYIKILKLVYPLFNIAGITPLVPITAILNNKIMYLRESSKKLNRFTDLHKICFAICPLTVKNPVWNTSPIAY